MGDHYLEALTCATGKAGESGFPGKEEKPPRGTKRRGSAASVPAAAFQGSRTRVCVRHQVGFKIRASHFDVSLSLSLCDSRIKKSGITGEGMREFRLWARS